MKVLPSTIDAIKAILRADPLLTSSDRNQFLAALRNPPPVTPQPKPPRIVRRKEAGELLSMSLRGIDKLAASGALPRRKLPGRIRAHGFLESDVTALMK